MLADPAPLLPRDAIEQAKRIADGIRSCEVAPLIGAGLSLDAGVPTWSRLVDRLINAWQRWDESPSRRLSPDNYVRLIRRGFPSDMSVISYLRRRVDELDGPAAFGQVLHSALYSDPARAELTTPAPRDVHRHLVALFHEEPGRIWTTNYDDLLEEAGRDLGLRVSTVDPNRRRITRKPSVAHLHGFLAPPDRAAGHPSPAESAVVLAEDDYHHVVGDVIGWTNRELFRLFDEYSVLIVGMSLDDPNVRRVLASIPPVPTSGGVRHFAVLRASDARSIGLARVQDGTRARARDDLDTFRSWFWRQYGVEVVVLPDHASTLPFVLRLRYESFGERPGDLWRRGGEIGHLKIRPWDSGKQAVGQSHLARSVEDLCRDFRVDRDEVVEMGVFLVKPDGKTLELVFRGGGSERAAEGSRQFSVDPDAPTGLAGRVFVSGDLVRVARSHPLHDYGLSAVERTRSRDTYEGIISVPIVDWKAGGIPLGVVYVTTARVDGTLFRLPPRQAARGTEATLDDLYGWLARSAGLLLDGLR